MRTREIHYDRIFLFDALNEYGYNDDEANGGGLNTVIDMHWFDTAEVFQPLIAAEVFWDGCPDLVLMRENRHVETTRENRYLGVPYEERHVDLVREDRHVDVIREKRSVETTWEKSRFGLSGEKRQVHAARAGTRGRVR